MHNPLPLICWVGEMCMWLDWILPLYKPIKSHFYQCHHSVFGWWYCLSQLRSPKLPPTSLLKPTFVDLTCSPVLFLLNPEWILLEELLKATGCSIQECQSLLGRTYSKMWISLSQGGFNLFLSGSVCAVSWLHLLQGCIRIKKQVLQGPILICTVFLPAITSLDDLYQ